MKDNRLEQRIQHSLNAELSGLNTTSWQRNQFFENATGGTKVKRKVSVVGVLIAALMLITITAFALTNGFGILEYHPDQSANQAYVNNIMTLNQTWDGKYFSATIHEAVFDGMKMTFTMSISPKENADPVFVIPRITAISGGKELHTFTTHSNVFMDDGFWVPCMEPDVIYDYDHIGVDVILTDDFVTFNPVEDQVEWAVSFDVLHTDWPIDYTAEDEPMIGEPEWTDSDYEKYEHQFVKAYEEAYGDTPNQFAADAYDAVYIIKAAIEKAGVTPDKTTEEICEALKGAMTQIEATGLTSQKMTWDASGEPNKEPKAVVIKNGAYVSAE